MNTSCGGEPTPESVPLVCEGVEIMNLDISADEGFLLSRIDGMSTVGLLCKSSGLGEDKTMQILASLAEKGVLVFRDPGGQKSAPADEPAPEDEESGESDQEAEAEAGEDETPLPDPEIESVEPVDQEFQDLKNLLRKPLPKGDELEPIVEAIFDNLENLSYYDILGTAHNTEGKALKKAYFTRTKAFHPDRFYRRADLEFKRKLQEIFKQVNKGYKLLTDPEARKKYDESLDEEERWEAEQEVEAGPASGVSRSRAVKGEASPWKKIRVSKIKPIEEKVRFKRKKEEKKPSGPMLKLGLKDGKSGRPAVVKKIEEKIREQVKGQRVSDAGLEQAEKFYKGAMVEKRKGNFKAAMINLKLAVQYSPGNEKFKKAYDDLTREQETQQADGDFRRGKEAQKAGDLRQAAIHYKSALDKGKQSAEIYFRLAEIAMELQSDYSRARAFCLKAIEMDDGVPDYHMALARAYKGLDQKAAAILQLEKVLKLEPKNKLAAKELKALKRG